MPMLAARLLEIRGKRDDYFGIALLISIAVHAGLLAVHFSRPAPPPLAETMLEVTLLNVRGDTAPQLARVIAQHDFDGGGTSETGLASTPLPLTHAAAPDEIALAALRQRQKELEAEQQRLFAMLQSRTDTAEGNNATDPGAAARPGEDELEQESVLINARIAAVKEKIERYNARPRMHFVGPSARSSVEAQYVEAWRDKIEQLGTEHYPVEARGKIYGSLQLTVYIRRDGSLERVEIDRPAAEAVLNQAALRIVQLAAPFPPLPPEMATDADILAITRTWHFTREKLETRIP